MARRSSLLTLLLALFACGLAQAAGPKIDIQIPPMLKGEPWTGRLTIYFKSPDIEALRAFEPAFGPFFDAPQPMYSMEIVAMPKGIAFPFRPDRSFPFPIDELPAGRWEAQAVLDVSFEHSSWRKEPLNISSSIQRFTHDPEEPPHINFPFFNNYRIVDPPRLSGVELFETTSDILTAQRGKPTSLLAGVVFPTNYDPKKQYPAVYSIPGFAMAAEFGADHLDAWLEAHQRQIKPDETASLWNHCFFIALNTQGLYGHHLLADSANNGQVERAFIEELIPALEAKYNLIPEPEARVLRGHSSGGWSSIWLAIHHPDVFGAAWASSPDPVDFRAFQKTNIYEDDNMFKLADGGETPSYRMEGEVRMTARQENMMEWVIGDEGGQQWTSWCAVFGPRGRDGKPVRLFDPISGVIDDDVAEHWRQFDIAALVREHPETYGKALRDNVRIIVGSEDNFYLNEAVALLKQEAAKLGLVGGDGYIEIVEGADHSTVLGDGVRERIYREILEHLEANGAAPRVATGG